MEPFKALTFLAAAGIVSFVGVGAVGFYAGYSAGRGNLEPVLAAGPGGTVSLKPVLEDIRALSKQVEALAAVRARPASDADSAGRPVLDEIKALATKIEGLKGQTSSAPGSDRSASSPAPDYSESFQDIRDQIRALNTKFEKQEPKTPKALVDEIRSLSASVQTQEPNARRAIAEEVRSAVTILQNSEPKVPKALMDEVRTISANVRAQDARPQMSVIDQIKVLMASVEALKAKIPDDLEGQLQTLAERPGAASAATSERGRTDAGIGPEVAQLRQLVAAASDQFGKCQTQLASMTGTGFAPQSSPAANTVAVSQGARQEPSAVVFYDNVMLKKDQEKQYDEIGVKLALQSIAPRQVRVAINRQGFGLAFGERKVFRSQDVECELNLMETNLNESQARVSISCKR
jgi:hypothetical protein